MFLIFFNANKLVFPQSLIFNVLFFNIIFFLCRTNNCWFDWNLKSNLNPCFYHVRSCCSCSCSSGLLIFFWLRLVLETWNLVHTLRGSILSFFAKRIFWFDLHLYLYLMVWLEIGHLLTVEPYLHWGLFIMRLLLLLSVSTCTNELQNNLLFYKWHILILQQLFVVNV